MIWLITIPILFFLAACWALCAAGGRAEDEMERIRICGVNNRVNGPYEQTG